MPENPAIHRHLNDPIWLTHIPPFLHGALSHSLTMSTSHLEPVNPDNTFMVSQNKVNEEIIR